MPLTFVFSWTFQYTHIYKGSKDRLKRKQMSSQEPEYIQYPDFYKYDSSLFVCMLP
jgi:hypothetical protein